MNEQHHRDPVVVGGLGGSGTRVLAMLLDAIGMLQGPTNAALDHIWFGLLLKRPRWYRRSSRAERSRVMSLFSKLAAGSYGLAPTELRVIFSATIERLTFSYNHKADVAENSDVFLRLVRHYLAGRDRPARGDGRWAFKEPNSYIFLEELTEQFPRMRYIHTVRNGLDMAFSSNQNQVLNWGDQFGIDVSELDALRPEQSIEFWVRANEHAIDRGRALLGDRFTTICFEELCEQSHATIEGLFDFLGLPLSAERLDELAAIPTLPGSHGRHHDEDLTAVPDRLLDHARELMASLRTSDQSRVGNVSP